MKTIVLSKKATGVLLMSCFLTGQQMFAQQQHVVAEDNAPSHNLFFILCAVFLIIGFVVLIALKFREDNKEKKQPQTHGMIKPAHPHHRHHYGHKHQYHH